MEYYTNCVAQRTRLRRRLWGDEDHGESRTKKAASSGLESAVESSHKYGSNDCSSDESSDGSGSSDNCNDSGYETEEADSGSTEVSSDPSIHELLDNVRPRNGYKCKASESKASRSKRLKTTGNEMEDDSETWDVKVLTEEEFQRDLIWKKGYDCTKGSHTNQHVYFLSSDDEKCLDYKEVHEEENLIGAEMKTVKQEVLDEDIDEIKKMDEIDMRQMRGCDSIRNPERNHHIYFIYSDDESYSDHINCDTGNLTSAEGISVKEEDVEELSEEISKWSNGIQSTSVDMENVDGHSTKAEKKVSSEDESLNSSESCDDSSHDDDYKLEDKRSSAAITKNNEVRVRKEGLNPAEPSSTRCRNKKSVEYVDELQYHRKVHRKEKLDNPSIGEKEKRRKIRVLQAEKDTSSRNSRDLNSDEPIEREQKEKPAKRRRILASKDPSIGEKEKAKKAKNIEDEDGNNLRKYEEFNGDDPIEKEQKETPAERSRVLSSKDDVLRTLLDSIMERGETPKGNAYEEEAKNSSLPENMLPLKFRFGDEDDYPPIEAKSEFDLMVEELFEESNYCVELDEMGSYGPQMSENREENDDSGPKITQSTLCRMEKHGQLYLDEQIGLRCIHCNAIVVEIQHVFPELVNHARARTEKRKDSCEDEPVTHGFDHEDCSDENSHGFRYIEGDKVWDLVPGIHEQLYPHQVEGFEFLWNNLVGKIDLNSLKQLKDFDSSGGGGCIISHAPGTGKTRLTMVFLESLLKLFPYSLPVIIAPASMLLTWEEEFKKWKIGFPFINMNNGGESKTRHNVDVNRVMKLHLWTKGRSVLGVSYNLYEKAAGDNISKKVGRKKKGNMHDDNLQKMREILIEMPGLVVLDEGHIPRNQQSRIWNTLRKLRTEKRVILSGTPFQNNFCELFNILRLVRPAAANLFSNERSFVNRSRGRRNRNKVSSSLNFGNQEIDKLKVAMAPFVHVHKGKILQKNLPPLSDSVVLLNPPALQKHIIEQMEVSQNNFDNDHKMALVSVHPSLLLHCSNLSEREKSLISLKNLEKIRLHPYEGVKTGFAMELIRLSLVMSEKVLIFSRYVHPMELIKEQVRELYNWDEGRQVLLIKGKMDQKHRQKLIHDFNDPRSEAKVLLASTKCCSEGISLIGASRVVLLDVAWNPSVERQAISRAYRHGQEKTVYTYHLITFGTSEREKYCAQAQKDHLSELVFSSSTASEENDKQKQPVISLEDKILEEMVGHDKLKDMFKKIIYQPKSINLTETFSFESFT